MLDCFLVALQNVPTDDIPLSSLVPAVATLLDDRIKREFRFELFVSNAEHEIHKRMHNITIYTYIYFDNINSMFQRCATSVSQH